MGAWKTGSSTSPGGGAHSELTAPVMLAEVPKVEGPLTRWSPEGMGVVRKTGVRGVRERGDWVEENRQVVDWPEGSGC